MYNAKNVLKSGILYVSMLANIGIGIFISILTTKLLGPSGYGSMSYIVNLIGLVTIFFHFGYFITGQRLIAQNRNESIKNNLFGSLLIYVIIESLIAVIALFIYSYFDDLIFKNDLGNYIRTFSFFAIISFVQLYLEAVFTGDGRINNLSINRTLPKVLYYFALLAITSILSKGNLYIVLVTQYLSFFVVYVFQVYLLKPNFASIINNLKFLKTENFNYGFHEYIGQLFDVFSEKISYFIILAFLDTKQLGFFALANVVTAPLSNISSIMGTTQYKTFANITKLPKKNTFLTIIVSISIMVVFYISIKPLIYLLYPEKFSNSLNLIYFLAFGYTIRGIGDYLNKFIGSKGLGKQNRNGAIIMGIFNIVSYTILIRQFGILGAAITKTLTGILYFTLMYYYYYYNYRKGQSFNYESQI